MRRVYLIAAGLLAAGAVACADDKPAGDPAKAGPDATGLVLEIKVDNAEATIGKPVKVTATVVNQGKEAVTLVQPGDGSDVGWRTPVVGWSAVKVASADAKANHPDKPALDQSPRCGNINALKKDEIFTLEPGRKKDLAEWVGQPALPAPGTYKVVFYYANEPGRKWEGVPLGEHDAGAMARVQKSTSCRLKSNEVTITVKEAN
jgi:hypothetical protein